MDKLRPASIGDADRGELGTQQSDGERREIGGNDDGGGDGDRSRSFEDDELQNPLIDDKTEEVSWTRSIDRSNERTNNRVACLAFFLCLPLSLLL